MNQCARSPAARFPLLGPAKKLSSTSSKTRLRRGFRPRRTKVKASAGDGGFELRRAGNGPTALATRRARQGRGSRCLLRGSGLGVSQHGPTTDATAGRQHGKRDRGHHERDRGVCSRPAQDGSRSAGAECGLAASTPKGGRDVSALSMLQQHDNDEEGTNEYVNDGNQYNHGSLSSRSGRRPGATQKPAHT